ncbi:MAG: glutamate-cysteine ligase family protein [Bdellovibrionota bacterium]
MTESLSFRSLAWRELDPSRTGLPKGLELILRQLNKASCVDVYTEMVLDSQVIFVEALGYKVPVKPFTFRQWLSESIEGINPTVKDFETQLSLMFPEVRPRNFLEIRSIDCQSQVWQVAPAAFCTGILYDDQNLIEAIDLLAPELPRLDSLLVKAANGLRDEVVRGYAQRLMEMAIEGFSRLPSCFLLEGSLRNIENFNKIFTSQGRTPGDDLKEAYQKRSNNQSLYEVICSVDRRWQELDV